MKEINISLLEYQTQGQQAIPGKVDKRTPSDLPVLPLTKPLDNIAVCMSGGGFRAAAFSLGTLAYLHEKKIYGTTLLNRVSLISSVSGGTITAAFYASQKNALGYTFEDCYEQMLSILDGEKLLLEALEILNTKREWVHKKNRNVINAFALAYDKLIFKQKTMADLSATSLRCCFNATEFYRGLTFRFQNFGYMGNQFVKLEKEPDAGKIKLADVLAASSCFPGGFEPINFPADYANEFVTREQLQKLVQVRDYDDKLISDVTIPLMDGGIADNQGITSAMIADLREREKSLQGGQDALPPIDLFLVSDVASYFMDAYTSPKRSGSLIAHIKLNWLLACLIGLSVAGIGWFVYALQQPGTPLGKTLAAFFLFPSVIIFAITLWNVAHGILYWLKGKNTGYAGTRELLNISPTFTDEIFGLLRKYLGRNSMGMLAYLVKDRIKSLMTMVNDVNLKQVRRLISDIFYNNPLLEHRRCSNFIYDYSLINKANHDRYLERRNWSQADKDLLKPTEHLMKMAENARTMGTTLWFDDKDKAQNRLQTIITCGKFTTCGNLIEYLLDLKYNQRFWNSLQPTVKQELQHLLYELIEDWKRFNRP